MASIIAPKSTPQPIATAPKAPQRFRTTAPIPPAIEPPVIEPPAVEPPAVAKQSTVIPTRPSADLATRPPAQPNRNDFTAGRSDVELASFAAPPVADFKQPAAPIEPPLQDSGSGWRRATRSIPSDSSYKSAAADFDSRSAPRETRQSYDSFVDSNYSSQNNYNNSRSTQQSYNSNTAPTNQNRAFQPYDLNASGQSQQTYSGQIRIADASPDRGRFAQQLNQSGDIANNYTGQLGNADALQTLNNRLTAEMLKAPSQWQLAPLEAATRQYMTSANYTQQQAAQQFLTKLANCRQVAAGYGGGSGTRPTNAIGTSNGSGFAGSQTRENTLANNAQFDATGWLNELKQGRGTEPSTYVLQDETGKIIYHVTPIPGLNLNRYLKKRVGVNGQLGFNQRLNLRHVTIERVFPL